MKTKELVNIALFAALICVGAFIKIPLLDVPITLQPLFVMLAGLCLKPKQAFYSVAIYLLIGLIGVPIFAKGGGIGYIYQPTFGYLIGFMFAVFLISSLKEKLHPLIVCSIGILVIYMFGIVYFYFIQNTLYGKVFTFEFILTQLFLKFLPGDLISMGIAIISSKKIKKILN